LFGKAYAPPDKYMLFLPQKAETKYDHTDPKAMGNKSAIDPQTNKHSNPKSQLHKSPQLILPAHKNTPCTIICRGC